MTKGWFNQSHRHSLAARGIRTSYASKRDNFVVYTLKLADGKYYVGWAKDKESAERRLAEHFSLQGGSDWTALHPAEELVEVKQGGWPMERETTLDLMREKGIENVRGSVWSRPELRQKPFPLHLEGGNVPNVGELLEKEEKLKQKSDELLDRSLRSHRFEYDPEKDVEVEILRPGFTEEKSDSLFKQAALASFDFWEHKKGVDELREKFSPAEMNVMTLSNEGLSNEEIGRAVEMPAGSVSSLKTSISRKLE
jgi:predicted GIY-YIG superfamily endonuclease